MNENELEYATLTGHDIHHDYCFACGDKNPHSIKTPSTFDEETGTVSFVFTLRDEHEGAPGHSHGGVLATVLDEAQGVLCHHVGHFVMTDSLSLKYRKAAPLHRPLRVKARVSAVRRRRLYTTGSIACEETGEVYVTSRAKWFILHEKILLRRFDFSKFRQGAEKIRRALQANRLRHKIIKEKLRAKKQ